VRPPHRIHRKIVDKNDVEPTEPNKNDSAAAATSTAKQSKVNSKLKLDERFDCLI
jgi:hypothetical protein